MRNIFFSIHFVLGCMMLPQGPIHNYFFIWTKHSTSSYSFMFCLSICAVVFVFLSFSNIHCLSGILTFWYTVYDKQMFEIVTHFLNFFSLFFVVYYVAKEKEQELVQFTLYVCWSFFSVLTTMKESQVFFFLSFLYYVVSWLHCVFRCFVIIIFLSS